MLFSRWAVQQRLIDAKDPPSWALKRVSASDYTLIAHKPIPKGTTLLTLPLHCTLSSLPYGDTPYKQLLQQLFDDYVPAGEWQLRLGIHLLVLRANMVAGSHSDTDISQSRQMFRAYIDCLPSEFPGVPLFYDAAAIEALQYPPLQQQITQKSRLLVEVATRIRQDHNYVQQLFNGHEVTAGDLGWAISAVSSRAFQLGSTNLSDNSSNTDTSHMLPLIDLMNHASDFHPNVEVKLHPAKRTVRAVTTTDVKAGTELTLLYGYLDNDQLLVQYGFVIDHNPYDTMSMKFEATHLQSAAELAGVLPSFTPLRDWQAMLLAHDVDYTQTKAIIIGRNQPYSQKLFAAMKLLLAKDDQISDKLKCTPLHDAAWSSLAITDDGTLTPSDRDALIAMKMTYELTLQSFGTGINSDKEQLATIQRLKPTVLQQTSNADTPLNAHHFVPLELALRLRIGKKQLLQEHISRISHALESRRIDVLQQQESQPR